MPRHVGEATIFRETHATTARVVATTPSPKAPGVIYEAHHPIKRKRREREIKTLGSELESRGARWPDLDPRISPHSRWG